MIISEKRAIFISYIKNTYQIVVFTFEAKKLNMRSLKSKKGDSYRCYNLHQPSKDVSHATINDEFSEDDGRSLTSIKDLIYMCQ